MPTDSVKAHPCQCVSVHCPSAYVPNHHHVLPQSWGGQTTEENMVWLCPNSHTAVHQLLNAYVHAGGEPDGAVLMHYNEHVQELAARAWEQRPSDHPPYTIAHSTEGDHHGMEGQPDGQREP